MQMRTAAQSWIGALVLVVLAQSALAQAAQVGVALQEGEPPVILDAAALDLLPTHTFSTSTIWTEGVQTFSGPSLAEVLFAAGMTEDHPCAVAINGDDAPSEGTSLWSRVKTFFGAGEPDPSLIANGPQLRMIAANDYSVMMPCSEIGVEIPIVANRIDGEPFSVRDKGPLWVVFPYDASPNYRTEPVYAYSIWQLVDIEVSAP